MLEDHVLADLEAAVGADPGNRTARLQLAEALLGSGHASGALVHTRILLSSLPRDPFVLGLAAMAADLSGDHVAAVAFGATLKAVQSTASSDSERPLMVAGGTHDAKTISTLGFGDVIGLGDERRRLTERLINPWKAMKAGGAAAEGVLLYGPPSVGKAFLAYVAAGELGLPVVELDLNEIVRPWGEPGVEKVADLVQSAASIGPCMVLLRDVEAVTHRRLRYTASGRTFLTDLLAVLDGRDRSQMMVVATSSKPWLVQSILRNRGRLSDAVLIGPPDQAARHHLLELSLRRRALSHDLDTHLLAASLQGATTSDIELLLDRAAANAYNDSSALGKVTRIRSAHVERALSQGVLSAHEWFDTAYNFPEFTDDSSQFDPLFDYIRRHVRRS